MESVPDNYPKVVLSMDKTQFAAEPASYTVFLPEWLLGTKDLIVLQNIFSVAIEKKFV